MFGRSAVVILAVTAVTLVRADEGVLPDGRRLEGTLKAEAGGRFVFQAEGRSVPLAQLASVRFVESPDRQVVPAPHRVTLTDGSSVAATRLEMDEKQLQLGTIWANDLVVPRSVVASVLPRSRTDTPSRRPPGNLSQDELWLVNGDQVFGKATRAGRDGITLQLRAGPRRFSWGDVRGLYFAQQPAAPQTTDGEHVRLTARSPSGETDEIEGVLRTLDKENITLSHPVLGEVKIPRGRLLRLRGRFHGRRIEIDTNRHHFGDPDHLSATLFPRRAEGPTLRRTVKLTEVPPAARIVVDVNELRTDGTGRVELHVNGSSAADLTPLIDRGVAEAKRLQVDLPVKLLRAGDNELELRLTPLRDSERHPSCGVSRLVLELPR